MRAATVQTCYMATTSVAFIIIDVVEAICVNYGPTYNFHVKQFIYNNIFIGTENFPKS